MPKARSGHDFEDEIREFLDSAGFRNVPSRQERFFLGGQEIDAFGRDDAFYVVVDAKTKLSPKKKGKKVRSYLSVIKGYKSEVINHIKKKYGKKYGYRDVAFIFWTKDVKIEKPHQKRARKLRIALRDDFDLAYYNKALEILDNGEVVRNSFLKDLQLQLPNLDVFLEGNTINANALRTKIGALKLYTFPMDVLHLLRFAYVFRIEMNSILGESYQRLLRDKKLDKIRKYLEAGGYFPNNIIGATEERVHFTPTKKGDEHAQFSIGNLTLPDKPCYLEIIDGQHRLYGYSNQPSTQDHCLWVTLVEGLSEKDRAKLFVSINKTQTPVPPDILWDLYQISEPTGMRGRISKFVYELNELPPFEDLISLPRVRSSRAFLSFSNFCSSLASRSYLFSKYGTTSGFKNVIISYFDEISSDNELISDWERSVSAKGKAGFICTNNSMSVLLKLLAKTLAKTQLPSDLKIKSWKDQLQVWVVTPLKEYLHESAGKLKADPYGDLRRDLTSEGARSDAADEIWVKSPLCKAKKAKY